MSAAAEAAAVEVSDGAVELPGSEAGVRKQADNLAAAVVTSLTAECRALNAALDEQARDEEAHAREQEYIWLPTPQLACSVPPRRVPN